MFGDIRKESEEYHQRLAGSLVHVAGPIVRQLARNDPQTRQAGGREGVAFCSELERLLERPTSHIALDAEASARYLVVKNIAYDFAYDENREGVQGMATEFKALFMKIAAGEADDGEVRKGVSFFSRICRTAAYLSAHRIVC